MVTASASVEHQVQTLVIRFEHGQTPAPGCEWLSIGRDRADDQGAATLQEFDRLAVEHGVSCSLR